jgi:hypothetical protein
MEENPKTHWVRNYKMYWGAYLLINMLQATLTVHQFGARWGLLVSFTLFLIIYIALNNVVAGIIFLLTWPARRNFLFSRYIKILLAFSAVYFLSQFISYIIPFFQD